MSLHRIRTNGADEAFTPMEVSLECPTQVMLQKLGRAPRPRPSSSSSSTAVAAEIGQPLKHDFLRMFEAKPDFRGLPKPTKTPKPPPAFDPSASSIGAFGEGSSMSMNELMSALGLDIDDVGPMDELADAAASHISPDAHLVLQDILADLAHEDDELVDRAQADGVPEYGDPDADDQSAPQGGAAAAASSSSSGAPKQDRDWASQGIDVLEPSLRTFTTIDGTQLGVIHTVGIKGVKATCKQHRSCILWVTSYSDGNACERDLVQWLAAKCEKPAHLQQAYDTKVKYGMKPRPLRS